MDSEEGRTDANGQPLADSSDDTVGEDDDDLVGLKLVFNSEGKSDAKLTKGKLKLAVPAGVHVVDASTRTRVSTDILELDLSSPDQESPLYALLQSSEAFLWLEADETFAQAGEVTFEHTPNVTSLKATDKVMLVTFDIEGYKRGTLNAPGARVPRSSGEYAQETVMLENADSENNTTQPDYATAAVDVAADDDLVKVVLHWPKDMKINRMKLELKHAGMEVDPTKNSDTDKYKVAGKSRLNFYKPDGTKLTAADLKIDDLGNPGTGYLAEILNTGELTLFIGGAENFGNLGLTASKMKLL